MAKSSTCFKPGDNKGNKFAEKHCFGSPRYVAPSDEELVKLGEEMVKWVQDNEPLHLSDWYTVEKMYTYNEWKTFIQRRVFIPFYEKAARLVSKHYVNGTIHPSIAQRFVRVYFRDVKDEEDDTLQVKLDKELDQKKKLIDHELARKAENTNVDPDLMSKFVDMMSAMSNAQSKK